MKYPGKWIQTFTILNTKKMKALKALFALEMSPRICIRTDCAYYQCEGNVVALRLYHKNNCKKANSKDLLIS